MSTAAIAPDVDAGNPPDLPVLLRHLVAGTPGRLGNTLRVTVLVLLTVAISETFRIPEVALSAYIILFLSRAETASTILGALLAGIAGILAIFVTIGVFMVSLAEPGLRIPLIAAATFVAMFFARAATLGPVLFAAGFIIAYGLTLGDQELGLALLPATAANTPEFTVPELFAVPLEEALVHFLLWLAVAVALPVAMIVVGNLLAGRDTGRVVRADLAERLEAASRFCQGDAGAVSLLLAFAHRGTAELLKLQHLSRGRAGTATLTHAVARLGRQLLAWHRLMPNDPERGALRAAAVFCHQAAAAVATGGAASAASPGIATTGVAAPLAALLSRTLAAIRAAITEVPAPAGHPAGGLLAQDAFSNPEYPRFALKVTLGVMLCYIGMNFADWPGIHTCVITCFFVSLSTVEETVHKAALRLVGCVVGATLGLGAILLLMPLMTDLGQLLLLLAPVTFLAAWIGFGGERVAYAGWQIGLAFYLTVLQGNGPTLDMETARDRVVGILIGNIVIYAIFTTIWPVRASAVARASLVKAVEQLAIALAPGSSEADRTGAAATFETAIMQAHRVLVSDPYDLPPVRQSDGGRPIDARVIVQVQELLVPVSIIAELRSDPTAAKVTGQARRIIDTHEANLAAWFLRAAAWIRSGAGAAEILSGLPAPPDLAAFTPDLDAPVAGHIACRVAWYRLLSQDIRAILDQVMPSARTDPAAAAVGSIHAPS